MNTFKIGVKGFPFPELPVTVQASCKSEAMAKAAKIYNSRQVKVELVN